MENTNNISNAETNIPDKKKIAILKKKISHLRTAIYIFVAISVLLTVLSLFWIYQSYEVPAVDTYFSTAPQPPKAFLYIAPAQGNYKVGDKFAIDVLVNTAGSNVVAAAAYLSYDKKNMEVESIDFANSLLGIVFENSINASDGKIKISLGKPTPGINVHSGKLATIRFKATQKTSPYVDNISFDFTRGTTLYSAVIIDDKKGTNILDTTRGAKIFID